MQDTKKEYLVSIQEIMTREILIVIAQNPGIETIEEFLDASRVIMETYKNADQNKRRLLTSYCMGICLGIKMANQSELTLFWNTLLTACGLDNSRNILATIAREQYPAPGLDELVPESENDYLKKSAQALQILMHLPVKGEFALREIEFARDYVNQQIKPPLMHDFPQISRQPTFEQALKEVFEPTYEHVFHQKIDQNVSAQKMPEKPEKVLQKKHLSPSRMTDGIAQQIQDDEHLSRQLQREEFSKPSSKLKQKDYSPADILFKAPAQFKPEPFREEIEQCKCRIADIQNLIFALGFEKGPKGRRNENDHDFSLMAFAIFRSYKPMPWEKINVSEGPKNQAMYEVLKAAIHALEAFDLSILNNSLSIHKGKYDQVSTMFGGNVSCGQNIYAGLAERVGTITDQPGYLVHQILKEVSKLFERIYENHPSWSSHGVINPFIK